MEKSSVVRFAILVVTVIASTSIYANQQALSFTVICMDDVVQSQSTNETETAHWLNDSTKKNLLFSVIAIGQLLGTLPVVSLMRIIGLRYTFSLYAILTAIATLATPIAVELGHLFLTATRIVQGFSTGIVFVSVGAITSHWSVLRESGTYIAILSCSPQLAAVLTMPLAGAFCESLAWRSLYYSFGMFGMLSTALFFFLYRENPKKHWMVNSKELKAIMMGKEEQLVRQPLPYKEICKDSCMQAVLLTAFGGNTAFFIFLHFGPTFMNKAVGVDVTDTGFATALPYALSMALKFMAGPLFDVSTFISEKNRLIMFASLSQGATALCFFVISQRPGKMMVQIAYCGACAFHGLNIVGSIKCAQMVARQHVHFVLVCVTICGCLVSFVLPGVVAIICPNNTMEEWTMLFLGASVFIVIVNVPFVFLASSEPASWTKSKSSSMSSSTSNSSQNTQVSCIAAEAIKAAVMCGGTEIEQARDPNVDKKCIA